MKRIAGTAFENIIVRGITVEKKKKPYWINVNYTVLHNGRNEKKMAMFRTKQRKVMESIQPFCLRIDQECSQLQLPVLLPMPLPSDSELQLYAFDEMETEENEAEDEDVPEMLDNDSDAEDEEFLQSVEREVMEENDENWDPNRKQEGGKADTLKAVPNDIEMKPTKINPVDIESLVRREIMVSLESAIRTGNFAAFVNLPVLEMVDEVDKTVKKVTDIGAHDLAKLIKKANSIHLYYKCLEEYKTKPTEAVKVVRQLIAGSVCQRQFWRILSDFEKNNYTFQLSAQGIHERRWIKLHDDTWGRDLRDYVRTEAARKGRPNMTVAQFAAHVNQHVIPAAVQAGDHKGLPKKVIKEGIQCSTARLWLHHLGCFFKNGKKDVYYDGHEREDVVEYRKLFIPRFLGYLDDPNVVVVVQDEVIYRSNEFNPRYWHCPENVSTGEMKNVILRKKGLGEFSMFVG